MARAPPVASKTTWSLGPRLWPNTSKSSGVERTRGPDQHASPSTTATSQKSLWTSSPMNRTCLLSLDRWRPGGANDNYGCVLVAQPDQSQGRPITTAGSRPIVSRRPARPGSPEAPVPVPGPYVKVLLPSKWPRRPFSCRYNTARPHRGIELRPPEGSSTVDPAARIPRECLWGSKTQIRHAATCLYSWMSPPSRSCLWISEDTGIQVIGDPVEGVAETHSPDRGVMPIEELAVS